MYKILHKVTHHGNGAEFWKDSDEYLSERFQTESEALDFIEKLIEKDKEQYGVEYSDLVYDHSKVVGTEHYADTSSNVKRSDTYHPIKEV